MKWSPSLEADSRLVTEYIPRLLQRINIQKRPSSIPVSNITDDKTAGKKGVETLLKQW
jgi:hypothetical protein